MRRLCWRHEVRLVLAAFTSLPDLSGKMYARSGKRILDQARECPRCQAKNA